MNLDRLMAQVEDTSLKYSKKYKISRDRLWYLLKLNEEVGELTQSYLAMNGKTRKKDRNKLELKTDFAHEIADVLCHILLLARSEGVDIKKAVTDKWLSR